MPFLLLVLPEVQLLGPNQAIQRGNNINLTCVIKAGLPKPLVLWYKNETLLVGEESTNLILAKVTDKDEGLYRCEARNRGGVADDIVNVTIDSKYIQVIFVFCPSNINGVKLD